MNVHPTTGNESVLGLDLYRLSDRSFLEEARRSRRTVIAPNPGPLVQGALGAIIRTPLYRGDAFLGWAQGVYDIGKLMDGAESQLPPRDLVQLVDSAGRVLLGSERVPDSAIGVPVASDGATWQLRIARAGQDAAVDPVMLAAIWGSGLSLLAAVLWNLRAGSRREEELGLAVRERTAELLRHQEMLQSIVDQSPVMIVYIGPGGDTRWVNPEWQRVLGYSLEEIRQGEVLEQMYPDPGARQEVLRFAVAGSRRWQEFRTRAKDGRLIETLWSNVVLSDGTIIGFGRDITDSRRAEEALRESERRLAEAERFAAIGRVSSGIAHEINNPLASIASSAELLEASLAGVDDPASKAAIGKHTGHISSDVERCRQIIEGVRGSVRREVSAAVDVVVIDAMEAALAALDAAGELGARRIRCSSGLFSLADVGPELGEAWSECRAREPMRRCRVRAPPGQLERVAANLLRNAVEATAEDGVLVVGWDQADDRVTIAIGDDGPGIARDALPYIFEPFYSSKEASGTGLGLYIARQVVESLGGEVTCESREGVGTVLRVRLPAAAAGGTRP